jgi:iron complex outermembrane receptor protein
MLKHVLWLGVALSSATSAQNFLRGIVRDVRQEPLAGATVQPAGAPGVAITDEWGRFELIVPASDSLTLQIRYMGYRPLRQTVSPDGQWRVFVLEEEVRLTDEVVVLATRTHDKIPTTFTNLNRVAIQKQNFGQDLPFLLNWTPSLVTTSDAGAGIGYTGMRIRGSDATRINVTINGIPVNDSESHGVWWVNMPDLASSVQSIQVQRGVGASTNGAAAFGASVNLQTNTRNDQAYADVVNAVGSFNSRRHTVAFGTGLINNRFAFDARLSQIKSDGFIDRAFSDLRSYYLSGGYYGKKTMVKALLFGGAQRNYQSWFGVPESRLRSDVPGMLETAAVHGWNQQQTELLLNSNPRTFNIYDYPNQIDNYNQDHYQLHVSHELRPNLTLNGALHYTYGRGFFEEFRINDGFAGYGVSPVALGGDTVASSDLVRRRWLDNHFYGGTYSLQYEGSRWNSVFGGAWNQYRGDHFGEVIWAARMPHVPKNFQYYFNDGVKNDFNVFWRNTYQLSGRLSGFLDLQYRTISHVAGGTEDLQFTFNINQQFNFFNPKAGLTYQLDAHQQFYASYAVANREPVRADFVFALPNRPPRHETLVNWEAGWRMRKGQALFNLNYYRMDYRNQLIMTGALNDVGAPIRTNVDDSFREGVEAEVGVRLHPRVTWNGNVTLSRNKIREFREVLYDFGAQFDEFTEVTRVFRNTDISFSPNVVAGSMLHFAPFAGAELVWMSKYVGRQFLDNTGNPARQLDAFFVQDVRLGYTLKPRGMRELSFSLLVNNVLNEMYESNGYTWGFLAGPTEVRQNFFYPQAGRHFMMMVAMRF